MANQAGSAEQWPRWPKDATPQKLVSIHVGTSVDELWNLLFGPASKFVAKAQEVRNNRDYVETPWANETEGVSTSECSAESSAHEGNQLNGKANSGASVPSMKGKTRMTRCLGSTMGMKFKSEELQRCMEAVPGKNYEVEVCVGTTATYGDRFRCLCRHRLEALGPQLSSWTVEFTLVYVMNVSGWIKKAIEKGAYNGLRQNFDALVELMRTFAEVSVPTKATTPAPPKKGAEESKGARGPTWVVSVLEEELVLLLEPVAEWLWTRGRSGGSGTNPAGRRTWLGLILAVLVVSLKVAVLQVILLSASRICLLARGSRLHPTCETLVQLLRLPDNAVTVWWGFALVWLSGMLATTVVRWMDARVRALVTARRARMARRSSSMSENLSDGTPLKGRRYDGFVEALEVASSTIARGEEDLNKRPDAAVPLPKGGKSSGMKSNLQWVWRQTEDMVKATYETVLPKGSTPPGEVVRTPNGNPASFTMATRPALASSSPVKPQSPARPEPPAKSQAAVRPAAAVVDSSSSRQTSAPKPKPWKAPVPGSMSRSKDIVGSMVMQRAGSGSLGGSPVTASLGVPTKSQEQLSDGSFTSAHSGLTGGLAEVAGEEPGSVEEEVFENERLQPFRGWGHQWPGHFLPTDRVGHWSRRDDTPGGRSSMSFQTVEPRLRKGWVWLEEDWAIDISGLAEGAVDEEGWTYAVDFNWVSWPPPSGSGTPRLMRDFVRKRRWVRTRVRVGEVCADLPQVMTRRLSVPVPTDDDGTSSDSANQEQWLDAEEDMQETDRILEASREATAAVESMLASTLPTNARVGPTFMGRGGSPDTSPARRRTAAAPFFTPFASSMHLASESSLPTAASPSRDAPGLTGPSAASIPSGSCAAQESGGHVPSSLEANPQALLLEMPTGDSGPAQEAPLRGPGKKGSEGTRKVPASRTGSQPVAVPRAARRPRTDCESTSGADEFIIESNVGGATDSLLAAIARSPHRPRLPIPGSSDRPNSSSTSMPSAVDSSSAPSATGLRHEPATATAEDRPGGASRRVSHPEATSTVARKGEVPDEGAENGAAGFMPRSQPGTAREAEEGAVPEAAGPRSELESRATGDNQGDPPVVCQPPDPRTDAGSANGPSQAAAVLTAASQPPGGSGIESSGPEERMEDAQEFLPPDSNGVQTSRGAVAPNGSGAEAGQRRNSAEQLHLRGGSAEAAQAEPPSTADGRSRQPNEASQETTGKRPPESISGRVPPADSLPSAAPQATPDAFSPLRTGAADLEELFTSSMLQVEGGDEVAVPPPSDPEPCPASLSSPEQGAVEGPLGDKGASQLPDHASDAVVAVELRAPAFGFGGPDAAGPPALSVAVGSPAESGTFSLLMSTALASPALYALPSEAATSDAASTRHPEFSLTHRRPPAGSAVPMTAQPARSEGMLEPVGKDLKPEAEAHASTLALPVEANGAERNAQGANEAADGGKAREEGPAAGSGEVIRRESAGGRASLGNSKRRASRRARVCTSVSQGRPVDGPQLQPNEARDTQSVTASAAAGGADEGPRPAPPDPLAATQGDRNGELAAEPTGGGGRLGKESRAVFREADAPPVDEGEHVRIEPVCEPLGLKHVVATGLDRSSENPRGCSGPDAGVGPLENKHEDGHGVSADGDAGSKQDASHVRADARERERLQDSAGGALCAPGRAAQAAESAGLQPFEHDFETVEAEPRTPGTPGGSSWGGSWTDWPVEASSQSQGAGLRTVADATECSSPAQVFANLLEVNENPPGSLTGDPMQQRLHPRAVFGGSPHASVGSTDRSDVFATPFHTENVPSAPSRSTDWDSGTPPQPPSRLGNQKPAAGTLTVSTAADGPTGITPQEQRVHLRDSRESTAGAKARTTARERPRAPAERSPVDPRLGGRAAMIATVPLAALQDEQDPAGGVDPENGEVRDEECGFGARTVRDEAALVGKAGGSAGLAEEGRDGWPPPDTDGVALTSPEPGKAKMLDQAMGMLWWQGPKNAAGPEGPRSGSASPPLADPACNGADGGDKRSMKQSLKDLEASAKNGLQSLKAAMEDFKGRTNLLSPKTGMFGLISPQGSKGPATQGADDLGALIHIQQGVAPPEDNNGPSSAAFTNVTDALGSVAMLNDKPNRGLWYDSPGGSREAPPALLKQGQVAVQDESVGPGGRGAGNANLFRLGKDAWERPHSAGAPQWSESPGAGATLRSMSGEVLSQWGNSMLTKLQGIKHRHFSSEGSSDGSPHPQESRPSGIPRPTGPSTAAAPQATQAPRRGADAGHVSFTDWALSHDHFAVVPQRSATTGGLKARHSGAAPASRAPGQPAGHQS
eukprot:jgi/Botrbrau1/17028/Bobra.49_2s0084.1